MPFAIAAAGVAAAGAIGGALISSDAAGSAADQQAAASRYAADQSTIQAARIRGDLYPYNNAGEMGVNSLMQSLGLGGNGINLLSANGINSLAFKPEGGAVFNPTQAQLEATPGYQFTRNQGLQAVANSNAAKGLGVSGAAMKGAAQYATGLADNTLRTQQQIFQDNLNNQRTIFQGNIANVLNPLNSLSTLGENSAAQTGAQTSAAINNANQAIIGGANASAAGTIGSANAISGGLSSASQAPMNYLLYQKLLGGGSGSGGSSGGVYDNATWD